jgi:hypothetical protein
MVAVQQLEQLEQHGVGGAVGQVPRGACGCRPDGRHAAVRRRLDHWRRARMVDQAGRVTAATPRVNGVPPILADLTGRE